MPDHFITPKLWNEKDISEYDVVIDKENFYRLIGYSYTSKEELSDQLPLSCSWESEEYYKDYVDNLFLDKIAITYDINNLLDYHFNLYKGNIEGFHTYIESFLYKKYHHDFYGSEWPKAENKMYIEKWLETTKKPNRYRMLPWNGDKKVLADIFWQLKNEITNSRGERMLPATDIELAELLHNNFDCFSGITPEVIRTNYFSKKDDRPKRNRILLVRE